MVILSVFACALLILGLIFVKLNPNAAVSRRNFRQATKKRHQPPFQNPSHKTEFPQQCGKKLDPLLSLKISVSGSSESRNGNALRAFSFIFLPFIGVF